MWQQQTIFWYHSPLYPGSTSIIALGSTKTFQHVAVANNLLVLQSAASGINFYNCPRFHVKYFKMWQLQTIFWYHNPLYLGSISVMGEIL